MKLALLLFGLLMFEINCYKKADEKRTEQDNRIDSLKLSELTAFAWSKWIDSIKVTHVRTSTFNEFDFNKFVPESSSNAKSKMTVYYSASNEIVKFYRASIYKGNDFRFTVVHNLTRNYTILLIKGVSEEAWSNEQNEGVKGFILIYKGHCYFVSFAKDPFCIMELDNHLKTVSTLRFCSNKLIYKTKVTYHGENVHSDILSKPVIPMTITDATLFSDIVKQFNAETEFKFEREMEVGWLEEWGDLPLWSDGGRHEYAAQLKPSIKELPYPELLFNCLTRRKK